LLDRLYEQTFALCCARAILDGSHRRLYGQEGSLLLLKVPILNQKIRRLFQVFIGTVWKRADESSA